MLSNLNFVMFIAIKNRNKKALFPLIVICLCFFAACAQTESERSAEPGAETESESIVELSAETQPDGRESALSQGERAVAQLQTRLSAAINSMDEVRESTVTSENDENGETSVYVEIYLDSGQTLAPERQYAIKQLVKGCFENLRDDRIYMTIKQ